MIKLNLQLHASEKITGKIERKYMAHLLNTAIGEETPNWVRLGKDLEELNIELNPDTETKEDEEQFPLQIADIVQRLMQIHFMRLLEIHFLRSFRRLLIIDIRMIRTVRQKFLKCICGKAM